jgi:hypothetical protein
LCYYVSHSCIIAISIIVSQTYFTARMVAASKAASFTS